MDVDTDSQDVCYWCVWPHDELYYAFMAVALWWSQGG